MFKIIISSKYHERYTVFMRKKDTCVIALVMFYDTKTKNTTNLYWVLRCVLYYVIDNYVFTDYLCCHSKTFSIISSDKIFEEEI